MVIQGQVPQVETWSLCITIAIKHIAQVSQECKAAEVPRFSLAQEVALVVGNDISSSL